MNYYKEIYELRLRQSKYKPSSIQYKTIAIAMNILVTKLESYHLSR